MWVEVTLRDGNSATLPWEACLIACPPLKHPGQGKSDVSILRAARQPHAGGRTAALLRNRVPGLVQHPGTWVQGANAHLGVSAR